MKLIVSVGLALFLSMNAGCSESQDPPPPLDMSGGTDQDFSTPDLQRDDSVEIDFEEDVAAG